MSQLKRFLRFLLIILISIYSLTCIWLCIQGIIDGDIGTSVPGYFAIALIFAYAGMGISSAYLHFIILTRSGKQPSQSDLLDDSLIMDQKPDIGLPDWLFTLSMVFGFFTLLIGVPLGLQSIGTKNPLFISACALLWVIGISAMADAVRMKR